VFFEVKPRENKSKCDKRKNQNRALSCCIKRKKSPEPIGSGDNFSNIGCKSALGELRSTTCCLQTVLLAHPAPKPLRHKGLRLQACVSTTFPTANAAPNIFKRPYFTHYQTAKFDGAFIHFSMNVCKLRDTSSLKLSLKNIAQNKGMINCVCVSDLLVPPCYYPNT